MNEREIRSQIAALEAMLPRRGRGRPKGTTKAETGYVREEELANYLEHKIKFIREKGPHGADVHARRRTVKESRVATDVEALRKRLGPFAKVTDLSFLEFVASEIQRVGGACNRWALIEKGPDEIMDDRFTWILAVSYGKMPCHEQCLHPVWSEIACGTNDGKTMTRLPFPEK